MQTHRQEMRSSGSNPIRTTIIGGLLFLVPFLVVMMLASKALQVMRVVAAPIAERLGVDHIGIAAMIDVVAIALILGLCYVAGRVATSERGRRAYHALDERLLDIWPRYGLVKAMASGVAKERAEHLRPVLVRFDDLAQLAFEVERDSTRAVVYLPGSPDPWSGSVAYVEIDRVTPVVGDVHSVLKALRGAGRGALEVLAHRARKPDPVADQHQAASP